MTLAEAKGVSPRCRFEPHDAEADRQALRQLAWDCQRWSPLVSLEESDSPQCLHLDLTGCVHLLGGASHYGRMMAQQFERYGFTVQIGMAATMGAAWAMAKAFEAAGPKRHPQTRGEQHELLLLAVEALRLSPAIIEKLHSVGITTIGELCRIPRSSLPSRFGPELLLRLDQMFGRVPELMTPERPPEPVLATWAGEEPLLDRKAVEYVMRSLVQSVAEQLTKRQLATQRLICQWKIVGVASHEFSVNLLQPTDVADELTELVELQLEGMRIFDPIAAIQLEAVPTRPLEARNGSLFESAFPDASGSQRETEAALASLVNRLSIKLGAKAVLRPFVQPDPEPERAVVLLPCVESAGSKAPSRVGDVSLPLPRPLFFLPQPAAVDVVSLCPEGPPVRFCWKRESHAVTQCWGPERIETGWWRDTPVRRDYFRTETDAGRRFWLFRERESARWFLHGVFA